MWSKLKVWFKDSEVIFWGRVQVLAGSVTLILEILFEVLSTTDLSVFISNPKTLSAIGIANGVITELLRRRRATDL